MSRSLMCRGVVCSLFAAASLVMGACSAEAPSFSSGGEDPNTIGDLAVELSLGDAVVLSELRYEITGNGFRKQGSANIENSRTVKFVVGSIPRGNGYMIELRATDKNDAETRCSGQATFDILAGKTSRAQVHMQCRLPRPGSVLVTGDLNACPVIEGVTVLPAEVAVGHSIALTVDASDVDNRPAALVYTWAANGGVLTSTSASSTELVCMDVGTFTVRVETSDGDCGESAEVNVDCVEPPPAASTSGESTSAPTGEETSLPPDETSGGGSSDEGTSEPGSTSDDAGTSDEDTGSTSGALLLWNEVESNGGTPDDWVELFNAGPAAQDLSGWVFKDNDDTHVYTIPAGSVIDPGQYLVLENFGFGLGSGDSARLFNAAGVLVLDYTWLGHAPTTYGRCPDLNGPWATTTASTKGAANDCPVTIEINEIESSGGTPGDWVELYNAGASVVDVSSWVLKDNDDTHAYKLPLGTMVGAGAYLVLDESALGFGLGGGDSVRLFNAQGALVDSHTYVDHAPVTYGRCPNGTGAFASTTASTKGATNACPIDPNALTVWPGSSGVTAADSATTFTSNLSGLHYAPGIVGEPSVLWGALNGPSKLYRLIDNGSGWTADSEEWAEGKLLTYPSGTGQPDSEGVTKAEWDIPGIYVAAERNNEASSVSRLSVLRFDETAPGATLVASHEWNLTAQLPVVGANLGLEGITWIPDATLVAAGFVDSSLGGPYDPANYPAHGTGLFVVGVEGTGVLYILALNHLTSAASIVASLSSGNPGVMSLEFDRDTATLWAGCDNTCNNQTTLFRIDSNVSAATYGQFTQRARLAPPAGLPNSNNEGIAFAPLSECVESQRAFFWSDDSDFDGHSLRRGSIDCSL